MTLGRYQEADALFLEALALATELNGETGYDSLLLRTYIGRSLNEQRRFAEAEENLRFVVEQRSRLTKRSALVARRELATSLSGQGKFAESQPIFSAVLEEQESAAGPRSPSLIEFLEHAAADRRLQNDTAAALSLSERAVTIARDEWAPGSWMAALAATEYGRCLLAAGRTDEARKVLHQAIADLQQVFGRADYRVQELLQLVDP